MSKPRVALLANQASMQPNFSHTVDWLLERGKNLVAIFSPQHGFTGYTQANMIEVDDDRDADQDIPIYSLYGEVRKPTPQMLEGVEQVIVDLQDVGARGYTYVWTLLLTMEACSEVQIPIQILDRPNPINGIDIEGPVLDSDFFSFVGMHEIPIRHGLTIGELALMMKAEKKIEISVEVEPLNDWKRRMFFAETNRPWIRPSPNLPTTWSTVVYPGMELLEGTNLSEGRGTTNPFELFGAPFVEAKPLCKALEKFKLPGVQFCPASFQPTFDKYKDDICHGAQIHVRDRTVFKPVATTAAILLAIRKLWPSELKFLDPPYEYETEKKPFDILTGNTSLREMIQDGESLEKIQEGWRADLEDYEARRKPFLLYS